jgi:hypothetical protein
MSLHQQGLDHAVQPLVIAPAQLALFGEPEEVAADGVEPRGVPGGLRFNNREAELDGRQVTVRGYRRVDV